MFMFFRSGNLRRNDIIKAQVIKVYDISMDVT